MTSDDIYTVQVGGLVGLFLNSVDKVQSRVSPWFPETGPLTEPGAHWFLARLASQQSTTTLLSLRPSAGVTGIHGFLGG